MRALKILFIFSLIQAGRCAEEALSSVLKRSERETPKGVLTEIENYAVYRKVNKIIIEVSEFQNLWDVLYKTLVETKKKLATNDINFEKIWEDWKFEKKLTEECLGRDYYGRKTNCQYSWKEIIKTGNCTQFIYEMEKQEKIEATYKSILNDITRPIGDFIFYINDTLKDFEPQLSTIKETINFGIKSCEAKEAEVCRKKKISWSAEEVEQYKTKIEILKSNATGSLEILKMISDEIRIFKNEFQNVLNEKKKEYMCCQKTQIQGFDSCSEMDQSYKMRIFRFYNEPMNNENATAHGHSPTTEASFTTVPTLN